MSRPPEPDLSELPELWAAHDHPRRPFDEGTMLCACVDCTAAIHHEAALRPRTVIGIKTGGDRLLVTVDYLAEAMADDDLERLLYMDDDYIRSFFIPTDGWLPQPQRWWSLTYREDQQ